MKALLIVDVQKDFCPGGALAVEDGDKVMPVINSLMKNFQIIIASRDEHPEASRHFDKWPKHCVKDTTGAEFHDLLDTSQIQQVFLKGTGTRDDGYSAFEATNVNLEGYLKERTVDEIYITGLATDYCVKQTSVDAAQKGFATFVVTDAVKGVNAQEGDDERALEEMRRNGVKLVSSQDIGRQDGA